MAQPLILQCPSCSKPVEFKFCVGTQNRQLMLLGKCAFCFHYRGDNQTVRFIVQGQIKLEDFIEAVDKGLPVVKT